MSWSLCQTPQTYAVTARLAETPRIARIEKGIANAK